MQFLINVIDTGAGTADGGEMAAIDAFNDRLRAEGHWVFAGGLAAPDRSTVIDNRTGEPIVTEGPVLESSEHVAGFWIIEASNVEEALRLATEGSLRCNRKVELRVFLVGPDDAGK